MDSSITDARPLVSCIMPTRDRRVFVGQAIWYFLRQDYENRELVIVDDGNDPIADLVPEDERVRYIRFERPLTLGAKRNIACEASRGALIAHWDDDDWMAPNRLKVQVKELLGSGADACGVKDLLHYKPVSGEAWLYRYPDGERRWVAGGSLVYRRSTWAEHRFSETQVGEDTEFVWQVAPWRLRVVDDGTLYVALLHDGNTASKNPTAPRWERRPVTEATDLLADDLEFYIALRHGRLPSQRRGSPTDGNGQTDLPLVSCIMPTYNRRNFVTQAIRYFLRQDYPNKELLIVDDGTDPVGDLVPPDSSVKYVRLHGRRETGTKRNLGSEAASGDLVMSWDDDDWYGPHRISYQVGPLLDGTADATALSDCLVFDIRTQQFWACTRDVHARMYFQGMVGGTVAFRTEDWSDGARFSNKSLAEEVQLQKSLIRRGARIKKLPNRGVFVYVRHQSNSGEFSPGYFVDRSGWWRVDHPPYVPDADLKFYRELAWQTRMDAKERVMVAANAPAVRLAATTERPVVAKH